MELQGGNLTQGNLVKKLVVFAIPFLLANFIQALYGAVDMAIVGWWGSASGISAVSTGSQVIQLLTSLISGLTMGGTILIAQYFGAGKQGDVKESIGTTLTLFGLAAVVLTVIMLFANHGILVLLQTPAEAMEQAEDYVMICSLGILFIFAYNAISAILRGLGDSKSPLLFIAAACVTNILLDLLLVGVFHMGAAGAAIATVISQAVSVLLSVLLLIRKKFVFDFKWKSFRIQKSKAAKIFRLGLPVSFQETLVSISFLMISAIVNSLGVVTSAAVGIVGKFEGFAMLPATAFCAAISSMVAQNMGANGHGRALKAQKVGIGFSFACSLVFFAWAQIAPESILYLFKAEPAVAAAGAEYIRSFSIDFIMVAFAFCMNGFCNGCGGTTFTMVNSLLSTMLVRVPLALLFSMLMPESLFGIGLAAPLATLLSIVIGFFYIRSGRWKKHNLID